ncbi:MAG: chemotaxis protein CheA [Sulfuricurvum sp.]|uniref:chemotaxis protein CheA n=1 Tax=Sulfuricurvum sp. TaxID=2025608 RepID=UPI0026258855|nr:chemotaxis protein CheA [Sulfuricurvum sp.]MDD2828700.1 chemotaxis protein CheA [Sulfuricurvum sp.]MDD4949278.1 chemotaxis protein CheA [Sulfuricurvum sp.]
MDPLLEQFLLEARENLAFIDQHIENIGGEDPELLNSVFRAAHTLKGGSGIVGFESVKRITHHAEDLLDMLRSGKLEFQEAMVESLYNAFDEVVNLIEAAEESGEIVDADENRIDEIAQELSSLMGKTIEEVVWSCPYAMVTIIGDVINIPMPFLRSSPQKIPFKLDEIDEDLCSRAQLYAIVFDVDESCMVYGNDPVYTLSLIADKVVGVHSCMSENGATALLSGFDDTDGLLLKIQMCAFVYATYDEIADALFNFSDELTFLPLDISTLLQIDEGESGHTLDVLKELGAQCNTLLESGNVSEIAQKIENSLPLIGSNTLQSYQLNRLLDLLGWIKADDLKQLKPFFDILPKGEAFTLKGLWIEEEAPKESPQSGNIILDEAAQERLHEILMQQLQALEAFDSPEGFERVQSMVSYYLEEYVSSPPDAFKTREGLIHWLRQELGLESVKEVNIQENIFVETLVIDEIESHPDVVEPIIKPLASEPKHLSEKIETEDKAGTSKKGVVGKTVKIEQESIDHLMNVVGELLVAKNSLPYLADGVHKMSGDGAKRAIMEKYTFINRLTEQLQDLIMSMRMLPISYVFDRYPKLVRDISKNLGKKVNLTMEGGETKLDKNMIEMLADPMIHIMRNSLDHGIESPEIRVQKGKNPEGQITLTAYSQSDKIIVEIRDDGAGINIDRVVQKVLEKDLLTLDQIDALSDSEKAELVMLPGLSTAEVISEYSGRGVGMDVVKKSIEAFNGTIRIKTIPNQGTTIYLSIPMSLAVTSLLHVSMNNVHYGFPMESVSETVKIESNAIEYLQNEPFIYLRGEVIPLLFIKGMLDEKGLEKRALPIVVLNIKGNLLAVVVNDLLGQLEVVQKPLEGIMENHPILSGTALLGNGQIIMVIDPLGMLQISHLLQSHLQNAS